MTGRLARLTVRQSPAAAGQALPDRRLQSMSESGFFRITSDVPDFGPVNDIAGFWEWCNQRREGLRQFRIRLGEPEPASVAGCEFRVIPEIVKLCRDYLCGFGATDIPSLFD